MLDKFLSNELILETFEGKHKFQMMTKKILSIFNYEHSEFCFNYELLELY